MRRFARVRGLAGLLVAVLLLGAAPCLAQVVSEEELGKIPTVQPPPIPLDALARHPEDPLLWKKAADDAWIPEVKAALLEETFRRLGGGVSDSEVAVAGEWLGVELRAGLVAEALADFRSLPAAVRARITSGPLPKGTLPAPAWWLPYDLRLDLTIAYILSGEDRPAKALEATLPPMPMETGQGWLTWPETDPLPAAPVHDGSWLPRRLVDRWLRPGPGDAFERLTDSTLASHWGGAIDRYLLQDRLARREGYPALAAYARRNAAYQMGKKDKSPESLVDGGRGLPPRLMDKLRRLVAAREELRRRLQEGAGEEPDAERAENPPADLKRDSDGDGLTDAEEAKLFTDPRNPDTDGDGVPDVLDPLPGVPLAAGSPAASSRAAAIASALEEITGRDPRTYKPGESPAMGEPDFLIADPSLFTGYQPVRRTVVIPWAERKKVWGKKLERLVSLDIFFDHSGRRAFVIWSGNAEGGWIRLEESGGVWKRRSLGSWIA